MSLDNKYGWYVIEFLERGYGIIVGNVFRRIFLLLLSGAVVIVVKIDGVLYEFLIILGVLEDVLEIIFNLKGLVIKMLFSGLKVMYIEV